MTTLCLVRFLVDTETFFALIGTKKQMGTPCNSFHISQETFPCPIHIAKGCNATPKFSPHLSQAQPVTSWLLKVKESSKVYILVPVDNFKFE